MRIQLVIALLLFPCVSGVANDSVQIDLNNRVITMPQLTIGDITLKGKFTFEIAQHEGSLIIKCDGKNVTYGELQVPWVKVKLVKQNSQISVNYLYSPVCMVKGKVNLETKEVFLEITAKDAGIPAAQDFWEEVTNLRGTMDLKCKVWGTFDDYLASGSLTVSNGTYRGKPFLNLFLNFFGKPPYLGLTDSKIALLDGSVYAIAGTMDVSNKEDKLVDATYSSEKVALAGWEMTSEEDNNVGVRKQVDGKFDVLFDTYQIENESDSGAELRYKIAEDRYLKLRMAEDENVVGFERRKEF